MDAEREVCGHLATLVLAQHHLTRSATKALGEGQYRGVDRRMALESIAHCREALAEIEAALVEAQREAA